MDLHWLPFLNQLQVRIPCTSNLDPLSLITDDAKIAQWNNEGKKHIFKRNSLRMNRECNIVIIVHILIFICKTHVFVIC